MDFARTKESESNQLRISQERFKELSVEMGQNFLPLINPILEKVNGLMKSFSDLSPEVKKNITDAILYGAALAPVLGAVGSVTNGIGGMIKVVGGASKAFGMFKVGKTATQMGALATAAGTTTTAVSGVGAAATTATSLLNPLTLGIVAVAGTGILVKKAMEEEAVPAIDLFAQKSITTMDEFGRYTTTTSDAISEQTKTIVQSYVDMDTGVTKTLQDLYINSTKITAENSASLIEQYKTMGQTINNDYEAEKQKEIETLKASFVEGGAITAEEQQKMIDAITTNYDNKIAVTNTQEARISEILTIASNNNRELTKQERDEITAIKESMKVNAITTLSAQESESNEILSRMKAYGNRITAEQGAETVRLLNESRDSAVATAEDEYNKKMAIAENMKINGGAEGEALANKLIEEATRQRDEVVTKANETRDNGISKLEESYVDLKNEVDTSTGEIITGWDKIKNWWNSWFPEKKYAVVEYSETDGGGRGQNNGMGGRATGTNNIAESGVYQVNEQGYELFSDNARMITEDTAYLPAGTQVTNHAMTKSMMRQDINSEVNRQIGNAINRNRESAGVIKVDNKPTILETVNNFIVDGKLLKTEVVRTALNELDRKIEMKQAGGGYNG